MLGLTYRTKVAIAALGIFMASAAWAAPRQAASSSTPAARVLLRPRLEPGQVMRYRVTVESNSASRRSGAISDSQEPSSLGIAWDATIRLEVSAAADAAAGPLLLRITYETSQATVRSDAPDPRIAGIEQQYTQLTGRSFEFTLTPSGQVSGIRGLEGVVEDQQARAAVQQWIAQLSAGSTAPVGGVLPGQKWESSQSADLPLAGLSWRTEATYLRNEPCRLVATSASASTVPRAGDAGCAVILSRLTLVAERSLNDRTPDQYRRSGLRTGGRWTGSGQNLMYVSLDTGWLVSSTQESTQQMDLTIAETAPNSTSAVRHVGSVAMRSQVSLLDDGEHSPAPPAQ
jgi:hypothetical protein